MKKLVVFDLDGTLNQTNLYAVKAHLLALAEYGITDKSEELIQSGFGARAEEYVTLYLGETDATTRRAYLDKVAAYEKELIGEYGREFEGTTKALSALQSDGYELAVCSNSSQRYITMVLETLHLMQFIDYIQPLLPDMTKKDTLKLLLEKVKPDCAAMVGDRIYDKEAAHANRIPFIGCMYGYNSSEVADADYPVDSAGDIYRAVKQLIG